MTGIPGDQRAFDRERLTVSNTAQVLTASKYQNQSQAGTPNHMKAKTAKITVTVDSIMFTEDGTTPTVSVGSPAFVGDVIYLYGYEAISKFKAIRVTTDSTIDVVYYR